MFYDDLFLSGIRVTRNTSCCVSHNLSAVAAQDFPLLECIILTVWSSGYQVMHQHCGGHMFCRCPNYSRAMHAAFPSNPSALGHWRLREMFACARPECTIHNHMHGPSRDLGLSNILVLSHTIPGPAYVAIIMTRPPISDINF